MKSIRIRYVFRTISNTTAWDDASIGQSSVEDALRIFAKIKPKFMLSNIIDLRLFERSDDLRDPEEILITGHENLIKKFIEDQRSDLTVQQK